VEKKKGQGGLDWGERCIGGGNDFRRGEKTRDGGFRGSPQEVTPKQKKRGVGPGGKQTEKNRIIKIKEQHTFIKRHTYKINPVADVVKQSEERTGR